MSPDDARVKALGLTKRQMTIWRLTAAGVSNQEIADRLGVVVGTLQSYKSRVFTKLDAAFGLGSRDAKTTAAAYALALLDEGWEIEQVRSRLSVTKQTAIA